MTERLELKEPDVFKKDKERKSEVKTNQHMLILGAFNW